MYYFPCCVVDDEVKSALVQLHPTRRVHVWLQQSAASVCITISPLRLWNALVIVIGIGRSISIPLSTSGPSITFIESTRCDDAHKSRNITVIFLLSVVLIPKQQDPGIHSHHHNGQFSSLPSDIGPRSSCAAEPITAVMPWTITQRRCISVSRPISSCSTLDGHDHWLRHALAESRSMKLDTGP